jgi:hypothetical protein
MEINARNNALAFQLAEADAQRRANSHKLFAIVTVVVVALGIGVFKYGMRSAKRDDFAKAAGYRDYSDYLDTTREPSRASSDYAAQIKSMASALCTCNDLKCAREAKATYVYYVRSHMAPDGDAERDAATASEKLYKCMDAFEAAGQPVNNLEGR